MADEFLTFEAKDVQVLGEEIFDEELQRVEKERFYTLDEQVNDAYEKLIPRGKRPEKAELEKIAIETERYRDMYETYIRATNEDYAFSEPETRRTLDWVLPVYAPSDIVPYRWDTFASLFTPDAFRARNGYERMIGSLSLPFAISGAEHVYPLTKPTESVDQSGKEPRRYLPSVMVTKTKRNEDDTLTLIPAPIEGTSDQLSLIGYYLKKRPVDVPYPQAGHDFFEDNEPRFVSKTASLDKIIPGQDAILTHGVKETYDPYGEGQKYLKVYDIALSSVTWTQWQQRFKPSPKKEKVPIENLEFPGCPHEAPAKNVLAEYGTQYALGMAFQHWLMNQADGGLLIARMLLSESAAPGIVERPVLQDLGDYKYPEIPHDEASLIGKDFETLKLMGTVRRTLKKDRYTYERIPTERVLVERSWVGFLDRKVWLDTTSDSILTPYRKILATYRKPPASMKPPVLSKNPSKPVSQQRQQILAVLNDETRFPEDKNKAVQILVRDASHAKEQYTDKEGLFVLCDHSLAILQGHMNDDRLMFYSKWTTVVDGFRVCRVCGEQISNDVLVDQDEFTDEGRLQKHASALPTRAFKGELVAAYSRNLQSMQPLFVMSDPSDATLYLLLSLLQVLPDPAHLQPVVQYARTISTALGAKGSSDIVLKTRGLVGVAAAACLLQIHSPTLVPRRSFGPKPLKIDGFPRDTASTEGFTVVDGLLLVLRKTFKGFGELKSFQGTSLQVIRASLGETKSLRTQIIGTLGKFTKQFASQYERAKLDYSLNPPAPEEMPMIPAPLPPDALGTITKFDPCPTFRLTWISPVAPKIRQAEVGLRPGLTASRFSRPMVRPKIEMPAVATLPTAEISRRLKIAIPSKMWLEPTDSWRTNVAILSHLSSVLAMTMPIETLDTTVSSDLLRDITKGYLRELLAKIAAEPERKRIFDGLRQKDITLYTLTASVSTARSESNSLRAKERHTFTDRMRAMTDADREVAKMLLDRGLGPFVITNKDRIEFATELAAHVDPIPEYGEEYEEMPGPADPAAEAYDMNGEDTFIDGEDNVAPIGNRETEQVYAEGDD